MYTGKRGPRNLINIQGLSPIGQKRCILAKRKSGRSARRPSKMSKEFLDKFRHKNISQLKMEAGKSSLGGIQRDCVSGQGSDSES